MSLAPLPAETLLSPANPAGWGGAINDTRRDLILRAARDEFIDKGLEGASMRSIARRAGCTTGAIYPQFVSKEAIYAALLSQSLALLDAQVTAAVDTADLPGRQVSAACHAFLRYYLAHPFEVNLGLYAFRGIKRQGVGQTSNHALNAALWQVLDRIAQPLALARGLGAQEARPLVALIFSQMIGALVLQLAGRLDPLDTDAAALLQLMLVSLRLPA